MTTDVGDCESLQRFETLAVKDLGTLPGWSPAIVCSSLKGWRVYFHHRLPIDSVCGEYGWQIAGVKGFCAGGYTHRWEQAIELGGEDWRSSSLAHEMCHVVDLYVSGHDGHCGWRKERKAVLLELRGFSDPSKPEDDCPADGGI